MPEQNQPVRHLVVPLETGATSFCYYENPAYYSGGGVFLPPAVLESIRDYADTKNLAVNFLYGNQRPPQDIEAIVETIDHVKILPLKLRRFYSEGVFVVNRDDYALIEKGEPSSKHTLIVRIEKSGLSDLSTIVAVLLDRCGRLNLILPDLGSYSNDDLDEYTTQLARIGKGFADRIKRARSVELSVLTDRLLLKAMKNCNAGISHCTVGSDGRFYVCPGFMYADGNNSAGSISSGSVIRNRHLLELEKAPVCSLCDAWHCKRCFFLNETLTLEINTPSRQQCVAAHLERNCSRLLRNDIADITGDAAAFDPIPELPYLDPLDALLRAERRMVKKRTPASAGNN